MAIGEPKEMPLAKARSREPVGGIAISLRDERGVSCLNSRIALLLRSILPILPIWKPVCLETATDLLS